MKKTVTALIALGVLGVVALAGWPESSAAASKDQLNAAQSKVAMTDLARHTLAQDEILVREYRQAFHDDDASEIEKAVDDSSTVGYGWDSEMAHLTLSPAVQHAYATCRAVPDDLSNEVQALVPNPHLRLFNEAHADAANDLDECRHAVQLGTVRFNAWEKKTLQREATEQPFPVNADALSVIDPHAADYKLPEGTMNPVESKFAIEQLAKQMQIVNIALRDEYRRALKTGNESAFEQANEKDGEIADVWIENYSRFSLPQGYYDAYLPCIVYASFDMAREAANAHAFADIPTTQTNLRTFNEARADTTEDFEECQQVIRLGHDGYAEWQQREALRRATD